MDTIEDIQRTFLKGQEMSLNAFNRLLAWRAPVIPLPVRVQAIVLQESPHAAIDCP